MRERIHAPDLAGATAWLNVERPPSIRDLRGQLVILDFWTYCCINCLHVLPVLRDLEERHRADPLVVIGVHSAKFDAEKDEGHILQAMQRPGVAHPVAVDSDMQLWSQYAVRSWPTLVIIRPDGTLAAVAPGEPDPSVLEAFVSDQLSEARADGSLSSKPLRLEKSERRDDRTLSFPGKVASTSHGRIVVSDSGHHRVLVLGSDVASCTSPWPGRTRSLSSRSTKVPSSRLRVTAEKRSSTVPGARRRSRNPRASPCRTTCCTSRTASRAAYAPSTCARAASTR